MMAYKANDPVWVKYSPYSPWWPALVMDETEDCKGKSKKQPVAMVNFLSDLTVMKVTSAKKIKPFNCPEKSRLVATGEKLEEKRRLAFQKDFEYVVQSGNVIMNPADVSSGKGETFTNTADNSGDSCLNLQNTSTAENSCGDQEDALANTSNDLVDLRLNVPEASAVESPTVGDPLDRASSESEAMNSHSENSAGVDPNETLECCKTGTDLKSLDNSLSESTNLCRNTEISQSTSHSNGNDKIDVEVTIGENNVSGFSENVKRSDSSNVEGDMQHTFDHGIDLQLPDNSVTKDTSFGESVYEVCVENDSETAGSTEGSQNFACSDYKQGAPKTSSNGSDVKLLDSSVIANSASLISGENSAAATSGHKSDSILDLNHKYVGSDTGSGLTGEKPVQNLAPDMDLEVENDVSGKDNAPRPSDPEPLNDSGIGSQFQTTCEESVAAERRDDSSRDVIRNKLGSVELAPCEKTGMKTNPSSLTKNPGSENVVKDPTYTSCPQIANEVENSVTEGNSEVEKRGRGRRKCSPTKTKSVSVSPRRSNRVTAAPHRLDMNDVSPAKRKRKVSTSVDDHCSNTVAETCVAEVSNSKRKRKVSLALNDQDTVAGPSVAELTTSKRKRKDDNCSNNVAGTGAEKAGSGRGIKKSRTQSAPSKRLAKKSAKAEDKCSSVNLVKKSESKKKSNSTCRKLQAVKDVQLCGEKAVLTGRGRKRARTLPLQPDLLSSPDETKKRKINVESEKPRESSPAPSRNLDALLESLKTPSKLLKSRVERKIRDSPPVRGRVSKRRKTLEEREVVAESVCTDNVAAEPVSNGNDLGQLKLIRDNSPELGLGPFRSSQSKSSSPHLETDPVTVVEPPSCQSKNCDSSLQSKPRDYSPDLGLGPSRSSQPRNGSPHLDLETEPDTLGEPPDCLSKCDSSLPSEQRSEVKALEKLQTTSELLQPRAKPARKARKPAAVKPARNVKNKKGAVKTKSSVYAGLLEDLENPVTDCLGSFESPVQTSDDAAPTEGKENCDESEATAAIAKRLSVMPYDPNVDWSGDSCKEDEEDDDDDDLPEAFCSSPAQTSVPKLSKGDFVWVKWGRYPYWPCMIRRVYYTKKKLDHLSVLFVGDFFEKGQKGIKVRYTHKAIRCYSCPERSQFIDGGKNSVYGPQFETALNLIEEYITKKGLGLTKQTSLEYFAYEEETWTDDEEDTPVDAGSEGSPLKATEEESREEEDSEDEDHDTDVLNISSDTPTSKRLAEIKMTRRDRYKEMVEFIQSEEVKIYLFDIYMGKKKSLLHDQFKAHPSGSKDICFGPIDDDNQIEEIQNTLMTWFNEINTGSSIDVTNNLNYVHSVWVPEAIVYAMRKTKHYTTKTAWERFEKGVYWTKVEHDNAHHAILNAVQNTSAESLEIHRKRTEAKSKKFLSVY